MGAKHFNVRLDKYTFNRLVKIQRNFEDETGLKITKTNIVRQAVLQYSKLLTPRIDMKTGELGKPDE